jgi:hypothetical protein
VRRIDFTRAPWLAGIAATALLGCRTPTQIEVVVTTNLPCAQTNGTALTSGTLGAIESAPPTTTSSACLESKLGSVVLLPSGQDDALVGFKVVTAINGQNLDACTPDATGSYGPNCIVARRALRYVPHAMLTVDVLMSSTCAGKTCDPLSTCVEGACVPATIGDPTQCEGSGCTEQVLPPTTGSDAGLDATLPVEGGLDATVPADSEVDGAGATDATADAPTDAPSESSAPPFDAGTVPGCDVSGAQPGSPWPMVDYCPSHRNRSPLVGPATAPHHYWTVDLPGTSLDAPSIGADGTLYIGGFGLFEALSPGDGGVLWQYTSAGSAFETAPLLAADYTVRAFDLTGQSFVSIGVDGGGAFSVPLQYGVRGGMSVSGDGTLYVSTTTATLLAFDSRGSLLWNAPRITNDYVLPSITGAGAILTATARPGNGPQVVYATNDDGGPRWASETDAGLQLGSVVVAVDGTLRVASPNEGTLYAIAADGTPMWSRPISKNESAPTVIAVSDDGTTYAAGEAGLRAWSATGTDAGTFSDGPCWQPLIDAAGDLYALCDGYLYALTAQLQQKWRIAVPLAPEQIPSDSPVLGPGGVLYVETDTPYPADDASRTTVDQVMAFGP